MYERIINNLKEKILNYVFVTANRPLTFIELLKANKIYNEGMSLENEIPVFRLKLSKAYIVFILLWHLIIIPSVLILHSVFAKVDCHISIILAIVFTVLFFATFEMFKEWLFEEMVKKQIQEDWKHHFPLFSYEKNHKHIAEIYTKALEEGVSTNKMRLYIFNNIK